MQQELTEILLFSGPTSVATLFKCNKLLKNSYNQIQSNSIIFISPLLLDIHPIMNDWSLAINRLLLM
jgi:hypothetical protein